MAWAFRERMEATARVQAPVPPKTSIAATWVEDDAFSLSEDIKT